MPSILSSIGIQPLSLVGQIVSFLILYYVFKKYLFGPILENLDKRAKKQEQALKAAEETVRIKNELQENEIKMKKKLHRDIEAELAHAQEEASRQKEEIIKTAQAEARQAAEKEYQVFAKKIEQKEQEIKGHLADLVIQAAQKALFQHLDAKTKRTIVAEQIKKLKNLKI